MFVTIQMFPRGERVSSAAWERGALTVVREVKMQRTRKFFCLLLICLMVVTAVPVLPAKRASAASSNERTCYTYLRGQMGLNNAAAAGVLANIYCESNFRTSVVGGGSIGLCQWLGVRRTRLNSYCRSHGYSVTSVTGQMSFLKYELQKYFPGVYNYLKKVPNSRQGAYNAASYFCKRFEIPYNVNYQANRRGNLARNTYWPRYKGSTTTTSSTTTSASNNTLCTRAAAIEMIWEKAGRPSSSARIRFTDVPAGSTYYRAVRWAVGKGITSGTSATRFSPAQTITRAQAVSFLWRWKGCPSTSRGTGFKDVSSRAYYYRAVCWAVRKGITSGTSSTTFSPNNTCTVGQIAAFLGRL